MTHLPQLFTPLTIKDLTFKNRIWMSPMCQYSSQNGHPTPWHWVHLGSRAVGGAGLIMLEASAVSPEGRISPDDSGFWSDDHIKSFQPLVEWIKQQGALCGIQIAHAGRKASTAAPWVGKGVLSLAEGGWQTIAPSAIAFEDPDYVPKAMNAADMEKVRNDFTGAAIRAVKTGFQVLELHMAHGYLMHQFLSPASNSRTDNYGGSLENRMRFPLEIAQTVRAQWPEDYPLFVRISATDWAQGPEELRTIHQDARHSNPANPEAWTLQDSLIFCKELKKLGVDLIDCSSGGTFPMPKSL